MSRVLITLLIGALTALGVSLLLLREEAHFVSHVVPVAVGVAAAASAVTWRRTGSL